MPSTVIRNFRYDPDRRRLHITFISGRRYAYQDVPADLAEEMRLAFSKGTFFNRRIKDRFEYSPEP
jgi:hypothetical protein